MKKAHDVKRWVLFALTLLLAINGYPALARADSRTIRPSDIEYSEPFEVIATIMEIDYAKNILIIAEKEIHVVNLVVGAEFMRTGLTDAAGHEILFDSLDRGQRVAVIGMMLPDGRIIAEKLVLQSR